MTETGPKQATFCFRCGRRVSKTLDSCWYCGAPTRRWLRRPKNCPFCGEEVRAEAVKCRHCGEFIDGRPRPAAAPVAQQVVFVVDRNLLQGMRAREDYRLPAGQPVPPEVAAALDAQTVRAIETGQPKLLAQPGVRALPAPADAAEAEVIDVEPVRPGGGGALTRREAEAPEREAAAGPPALRGERLPAARPPAALRVAGALVKAGGWLIRKALAPAPAAKTENGDIAAEAHDPYRICVSCQSEILTQDNYCYHCGQQYHTPKFERAAARRQRKRLRTGQLLAGAVLIFAYALIEVMKKPLPGAWAAALPALPAAAGVLAIAVLVRGKGFFNKVFSLGLIATVAAAWWLFS